jgi:phosphonopyruvate decarboxylase
MGEVTVPLLNTLRLGHERFPNETHLIPAAMERAITFMERDQRPYVFLMKKNDVSPYELRENTDLRPEIFSISHEDRFSLAPMDRPTRTSALRAVQELASKDTLLVATTGKTGRELFELEDRPNQFYMVGSMGCALPLGLGLALSSRNHKVWVLDGDGALLMRTGSMATVGYYRPSNLIHILLDNEVHDSTGGQRTVSGNVSFGTVAKGFGYGRVFTTDDLIQFRAYLQDLTQGPTFIHLKIKKGSPHELGRPGIPPFEVARRFQRHLFS